MFPCLIGLYFKLFIDRLILSFRFFKRKASLYLQGFYCYINMGFSVLVIRNVTDRQVRFFFPLCKSIILLWWFKSIFQAYDDFWVRQLILPINEREILVSTSETSFPSFWVMGWKTIKWTFLIHATKSTIIRWIAFPDLVVISVLQSPCRM